MAQAVADLGIAEVFENFADKLLDAELIFVDGPKDGVFEPALFSRLYGRPPKVRQLLILDDIRVMSMVKLWRGLSSASA